MSHWLEARQPLLGKKKTELRMLQVERGAWIQGYSQWVEPNPLERKPQTLLWAGDLGRDSHLPWDLHHPSHLQGTRRYLPHQASAGSFTSSRWQIGSDWRRKPVT